MKLSKSITSILLAATFAFAAGCAGISDANLSEADADNQLTPVVTDADFQADIDSQNNGEDEDIIIVRPRDSYDDRD